MSLTTGVAPFSRNPAGRFDPPVPADPVYVEPLLRRVRAKVGDRAVIDSERVVLVHRPGTPPTYAFPAEDVRDVPTSPEPAALGYVRVAWTAASAWYEEEEQVFGGHPRNPYHRIDCIRACRQLRVEVAGAVLVDTTDVISLHETSRAPELYVGRELVRMDLLVGSKTLTYCPYKGWASHYSALVDGTLVRDVAWSYDDPLPESTPVARMLGFYADRTQMIRAVPGWFEVPPSANPRVLERDETHG
jgi:uncharacterized protein (DUF427 family)